MKSLKMNGIDYLPIDKDSSIDITLNMYNDTSDYFKIQLINEDDKNEIGTISLFKEDVEMMIDILKNHNKGLKEIKY